MDSYCGFTPPPIVFRLHKRERPPTAGKRLPAMLAALMMALAFSATWAQQDSPAPPGAEKSAKTQGLELGAKILQGNSPAAALDIHLGGFHVIRDEPLHQMEAQHYCRQLNEEFAQCVLFDGDSQDARMNGVEYIISERLFASLPDAEKQYWHPHNYEILSGQLVAPGIPAAAEQALMKSKINSYGKTWHFWRSGVHGQAADALPLGEPRLAWSFNRDGEILPNLLEKRDQRMGIDTADTRRNRDELRSLARPQSGVDAMKGRFPGPTREVPGVADQAAAHGGSATR